MTAPIVFLIDNGSLRPDATHCLRALAAELATRSGLRVDAVSLLHSHKIDPVELGGQPATIVKRRLQELLQSGERRFIMLPLFLGPSLAIAEYLPEVIAEVCANYADAEITIGSVLAGEDIDSPDPRLAAILADSVSAANLPADAKVALVDHGTPIVAVNRVRNAVARQLSERLGAPVQPCSMERREGEEYDFNEPLLEGLGGLDHCRGGHLLLAMFFLLPGRHAGAGGDVAEMIQGLMDAKAFERITITPLLGEHPLLLDILEDRLRAALAAD